MKKQTLQTLVQEHLFATAEEGALALCLRARVSPTLIRKIVHDGYQPLPRSVYKIAIACGASKTEASRLAKDAA